MYFVCRWREESPFSKRVVTVPDTTVLDWFRRGWGRDDPRGWIESELGEIVYGLDSIFDEAQERHLPPPETVDDLRDLLNEHLWVEGDDDGAFIRLGEHALRVRTDDDEVDLAYYFIDEDAAAASPDRLAYLLHDTWPLPPTPPRPVRSSSMACRYVPSASLRPGRRPSSRSVCAGIRLVSRRTWIWLAPSSSPASLCRASPPVFGPSTRPAPGSGRTTPGCCGP